MFAELNEYETKNRLKRAEIAAGADQSWRETIEARWRSFLKWQAGRGLEKMKGYLAVTKESAGPGIDVDRLHAYARETMTEIEKTLQEKLARHFDPLRAEATLRLLDDATKGEWSKNVDA